MSLSEADVIIFDSEHHSLHQWNSQCLDKKCNWTCAVSNQMPLPIIIRQRDVNSYLALRINLRAYNAEAPGLHNQYAREVS